MDTSDARNQLEATISTLDEGIVALSPTAARGLIERWLNTLAEYPGLNDVATTLGELRAALADQPIDGDRVGELLRRLGARTTDAAAKADDDAVRTRIERLGSLLSKGGAALGASGEPPSRQEINASGEPVQQPSSPHGPNPPNPGRKAEVGDVQGNASSGTPGQQYNPN